MTDIVQSTNTSDLLPNPETRDDTLAIIHNAYQKAVEKSKDILDIVRCFYEFLKEAQGQVPNPDKSFYFKFLAGVGTCYQERKKTFKLTNFVSYIHIIILYIILWMNSNPQAFFDSIPEGTFEPDFKFDLDVRAISRRKALESDLFKILKKSLRNDHLRRNSGKYAYSSELSAIIRDRLGILLIVQNELSSEMEKKCINAISSCIIDIFCSQNLDIRESFIEWLRTSPLVDDFEFVMMETLLHNISFCINHYKDYIASPKPSGYQTLQYTLVVEHPSEKYGGFTIEVQIRSKRMHDNAVNADSEQAHFKHKNDFSSPEFAGLDIDKLVKVIHIDDFSKVNIVGFTGYEDEYSYSSDNFIDIFEVTNDKDVDGIHLPKVIYQRRISPSVSPSVVNS